MFTYNYSKELKKTIIESVIVLIAFITLIYSITCLMEDDFNAYVEETKCIKPLISKGIERKDIAIIDGICVVGEDFYYKYSQ